VNTVLGQFAPQALKFLIEQSMSWNMQRVQFTNDGSARWAGMGDFVLVSPDSQHTIELTYVGEPAHGDSYHRANIDGSAFPGYAWGCMFAFAPSSRFAVFSWMRELFERRTVAVDMQDHRYLVLPEYIYDFVVQWPSIVGRGQSSSSKQYTVMGHEQWAPY
jgi:hypothetical protein